MSVQDFFKPSDVDLDGLSAYLDGLDNRRRIDEACRIKGKQQQLLFEAAEGYLAVDLDYFVPTDREPLEEVIHHGRNSMKLFSKFQKRMCRPDRETAIPQVWGYNEQSMKALTGPGYFVAKRHGDTEVVIDYFETPPAKPDSWPKILANSARLSRFIYYQTRDYMRGVSKHVSIGHAKRNEEPMPNWFVLCREER